MNQSLSRAIKNYLIARDDLSIATDINDVEYYSKIIEANATLIKNQLFCLWQDGKIEIK